MTPCPICTTPFTTPKGVTTKEFCSAECRKHFHSGCRLLGQRLYHDGAVSIEQVRAAAGLNIATGGVNGALDSEGAVT